MRLLIIVTLAAVILFPIVASATKPALPPATCEALADRMLAARRLPAPVRDAQELFTWRAGCAEAPPGGRDLVRLLCEADYDLRPGVTGRVFYWEKIDGGRFTAGSAICRL